MKLTRMGAGFGMGGSKATRPRQSRSGGGLFWNAPFWCRRRVSGGFALAALITLGLIGLARADSFILATNDALGSSSFNTTNHWIRVFDSTPATNPPSPGNSYDTGPWTLLTPAANSNYTFRGDSLTISDSGKLIFEGTNGNTITISNLTLAGGTVANGKPFTSFTFAGSLMVTSASIIDPAGSGRTIVVSAILSGTETLTNGTGAGTVSYTGSNTFFTGAMVVRGGATLRAGSQANLGGDPFLFNDGQLTLDNGIFAPIASFSLDNGNSGITLGAGGGTFNVATGLTMRVLNPLTGPGQMHLTGGGTLALSNLDDYISNKVTVTSGTLDVSGNSSQLTLGSDFIIGPTTNFAGTLTVSSGGVLSLTNGTLWVGNNGSLTNGNGLGFVTISDGAFSAQNLNVGSTVGGLGRVTIQGNSVVDLSSNLTVLSGSQSSTSILTVASGSLLVTNGVVQIGHPGNVLGNGLLIMSGGTNFIRRLRLGGTTNGASGVFAMADGFLRIFEILSVNHFSLDGGFIDGTDASYVIGDAHSSQGTMHGGECYFGTMVVGFTQEGTYTQLGGIMGVTNVLVGHCGNQIQGHMSLSGGTFYATNEAGTVVFDDRNGTIDLDPGFTLVVDNLILTNVCGQFHNNGGSLEVNHPVVLDPALDADGDGQSNGAELAAGTDPLDPSSVCAQIPANLISWWPAGNNALDVVGGKNGSLVNGAGFAAGKVGTAFSFNGGNQYVSVPHQSALNAFPLTVCAWINTAQTLSDAGLINKYFAGSFNGWLLYLWNGGVRAWYFHNSANYIWDGDRGLDGGLVSDGNWHHVAFTVDANGGTIYVDGVAKDSRAWVGTPGASTTTQELRLGDNPGSVSQHYYAGLLDETLIFNRALTQTEVQSLFNAEIAGFCIGRFSVNAVVAGNGLILRWQATPGFNYRVQYATDVTSGVWTDQTPDVTPTTVNGITTIPLTGNAPRSYYRLKLIR